MEISFDKLQSIIAASGYSVNGSETEKLHGYLLSELFPNSEVFWKTFIVPFTNRIDESIEDFQKSITPRDGIAERLQEIGSFHYSIFHNFLYAHAAINKKHLSYFENFYTHLGTICDCVEEFLINLYLIILECNNIESPILKKLSKEEFIAIAEKWFENDYPNVYEHYLSKGKSNPIKIPTKKFILSEYFEKLPAWKEYVKFSQLIRQYRNIIVHNYTRAFLVDEKGNEYIPKKEVISEYKKWADNNKAVENPEKFKADFVLREVQMKEDLEQMKSVLQNLWEKPILDMTNLFLVDKNNALLIKYDLSLI